MAWLGFWIFCAALVWADAWLYSKGHNALLFHAKTTEEKAIRAREVTGGLEPMPRLMPTAKALPNPPQPCTCPTRDWLDAMLCDAIKRRSAVEQALYDMAGGKVPMPDAAKLRELARQLSTPNVGAKRTAEGGPLERPVSCGGGRHE